MEARKSLGQHWLHSEYIDHVLDMAGLRPGEHVLEIGPGLGTMTEQILAHGVELTAVELDEELFARLQESTQNWYSQDVKHLKLVQADILQFDLSTLAKDYQVVANIPYYLTGKLLRKLTDADNPPSAMTLLVQRQVAERLAARPGKLSIIGVVVQLFGTVTLGEIVPASAFTPPPEVDSQVVHIVRHPHPLFPDLDRGGFLRLVKAGFSEKRKKLRSALSGGLQIDKTVVDSWLQQAKVSNDARAQELSLKQWYKLWQTSPL